MLQKNDWRIMSQDSYIHGRKFKKNIYHTYRPGWDHDHCIYCTEKFAEKGLISDSIQEGYSTVDEGLWACPQCYEDFKNYYDMPLIPNTVIMVENGLNDGKVVTFSLNNERYILKKTDEKICVSHNGSQNFYSSFSEMKRIQTFYNKNLDEVIDEIFMSIT